MLFGLLRSGAIKNSGILRDVHIISIILYSLSLFITYLSFVYSNVLSEIKLEEKVKAIANFNQDPKNKRAIGFFFFFRFFFCSVEFTYCCPTGVIHVMTAQGAEQRNKKP